MRFDAYDVAIQLVAALKDPLIALRAQDGDLAAQARRAAQSVVLNVAEGHERTGRDRVHLFKVALGSAAEVGAALDTACAWGYLASEALAGARALLDRERAML